MGCLSVGLRSLSAFLVEINIEFVHSVLSYSSVEIKIVSFVLQLQTLLNTVSSGRNRRVQLLGRLCHLMVFHS